MNLEHSGAGPRRYDHIVERRESLDHLLRDRPRIGAVPGIEGRLAATGLSRHLDRATCVFQELHRGEANRWADKVHQAGDEESDAPSRHVLVRSKSPDPY